MEGGNHREAQLVAKFREPKVDKCGETERDVYQVDLLAAKEVGDGALGSGRRDDVSMDTRQRPQRECVVGHGCQRSMMNEEHLDAACPKAGDGLPGVSE